MTTYTVREHGKNRIVEASAAEVARYRKDEVAADGGYTDIDELKRTIRADLNLRRSDRLVVEE
jgi:hypothetical protein